MNYIRFIIKIYHKFKLKGILLLLKFYEYCALNKLKFKSVICPCCGYKGKSFEPMMIMPLYVRNNAKCPKCLSFERHRALYSFYKDYFSKISSKVQCLHYGAEDTFKNFFNSLNLLEYYPIYYLDEPEPVATKVKYENLEQRFLINGKEIFVNGDMQNIEFESNTIDYIIHHHVLEHVEDENLALQEMFRVLKKGGKVFMNLPMHKPGEKTTFNNKPDQMGHWRHYGDDSKYRFEKQGFKTKVVFIDMNKSQRKKYGIAKYERIWILEKPN